MGDSKIDKRIRNARLAVQWAKTPHKRSLAQQDLDQALADKERMKVTRR